MKNVIVIISILVLFTSGILLGQIVFNKFVKKENNVEVSKENNEVVTDECTEEHEEMEKDNNQIQETSTNTEKISPNCSIILNRYYKECGHTIEQYTNVPTELINKTEEDLKKEYEGWEIREYSTNQIVLYREFDSQCGEHYLLKEKDGKVSIFLKVGDEEEFVEDTDIGTEFLTETDKIELKKGIEANGRTELNQLIEDYE